MFFKNKTSNKERGGRNWIILVFSLLLAFIMWGGQKFSKDYSWYLNYKVEVTTNIPGRANTAKANELLIISAKIKGFKILSNVYRKDKQVLKLEDIDYKLFHKKNNGDIYYISPLDIKQKIQEAIGGEVLLESIVTDSLTFNIPPQVYRRVPIIPKFSIIYKSQYMPIQAIKITPEVVDIFGDLETINRISSVSTELIKGDDVMTSISGVVKLNPIKGVKYSVPEVIYTQEVGRYVESKVLVPIVIENAPDDINITIIPNIVEISYRQLYSKVVKRNSSDFIVAVDYFQILNNRVVQPRIVRKPNEVISYTINPKFVECIF